LLLDFLWVLNLMLALRTDSIHNRTDSLCRRFPLTRGGAQEMRKDWPVNPDLILISPR